MLILCKAWAPRRRLCDVQNEGRLLFPCEPFDFYFLPEKQDFKKVVLILAVFSWRRGRRVAFFRPSEQTFDSLQLWLCRGLQSRVNGRHMLRLHMLLSSVAHSLLLCAWMKRSRRVCFSGVYLEGKGVVIVQGSLSVSLFAAFTVKSESCQIQKWRVPDLTQDLCRQTRRLSCFLIRCLFLLCETHTDTHIWFSTLLTTSTDSIHFLNHSLKPCLFLIPCF